MEKSKKIVSLIIIFIMIISYIYPVMAVTNTAFTVKKVSTRDGYEYYINNKRVNKFIAEGYDSAYCLKAEATFKGGSASYNRRYNMKADIEAIKEVDWGTNKLSHTKKTVSIKRTYEKADSGSYSYTKPVLKVNENGTEVTYCNYNAVLWILDHMYVPISDTNKNKEFKKELYEAVFEDAIIEKNFDVSSVKLTAEDIKVVQQWAIWYFTNSENSKYHVTELPTVKVKDSSGTLRTINSLGETGRNQKYMNALYVYLIENAMKESHKYGYGNERRITTNFTTTVVMGAIDGQYKNQQPIAMVKRKIPDDNKYKVIIRKYDRQTGKLINSEMKVSVTKNTSEPDTDVMTSNSSTQTVKGTKTVATCDINDILGKDKIVVEETQAPNGYNKLKGNITLTVSKKILNGTYSVSDATVKYGASADKNRVGIHVNKVNTTVPVGEENNAIYIDIYDDEIEAGFDLKIKKVDADTNNTINSQAAFVFVEKPNNIQGRNSAVTENGIADFGYQTISSGTKAGIYEYYIKEESAPVGYTGLAQDTMIKLSIKVGLNDNGTEYIITDSSLDLVDNNKNVIHKNLSIRGIKLDIQNNNEIILTIPNDKVSGEYEIDLVKVDEDSTNTTLSGAEFDISCTKYNTDGSIISTDSINSGVTRIRQNINSEGRDVYTITERKTPYGYIGLENPVEVTVTKKLVGSEYIIEDITTNSDKVLIERNSNNDNGITIKIKNKKLDGAYELQIEKQDENGNSIDGAMFMVYYPNNDGVLTYENNDKTPNPTSLGKRRISQEGTDEWVILENKAPDGYIGLDKKIHIFVEKYLDTENNKWDVSNIYIKDEDGNDYNNELISLEKDNENNIFKIKIKNKKLRGNYNIYFSKEDSITGNRIYSKDTTFKVKRNEKELENITLNMGMKIVGPFEIESNMQIDTYTIEEIKAPEGYKKLKEPITFKVHTYERNGQYVAYWVETDSDYIDAYIGSTGTVFITIDNDKITDSYQLDLLKIDADTKEQLNGAKFEIKYPGEEEYKEIIFEDEDFLTDLIEINEEGTDTIYIREKEAPQGYEKLIDELKIEVNKKIKNENYVIEIKNVDEIKKKTGTEVFLENSSTIGLKIPNKIKEETYSLEIIKFDEEKTKLSGAEFTITMPDGSSKKVLTDTEGKANIGEVKITSEGTDEYIIKETKAPEGYQPLSNEFKIKVKKIKTKDGYQRGDIELIKNDQNVEYTTSGGQIKINVTDRKITDYDLSLRKFITSVNDNKPEVSREPVVDTSKLVDGSSTTATYTHTKEPLLVANTDTVIYTLRMYNEGISDAYVAEVEDDIPLGLEFILDNEINTKYNWKMYDESGKETTDVTKAKKIKTDYLSKEKSEEREEDNLLKAFDYKKETKLDYRDVQVAFKVVGEKALSDRIIINTAEITKETNEKGEDVKDRDSEPNNNKENEDDIDKEYLKLKYFDLSLLKWVSSTIIVENGKTTETLTGHTGLENPEPVVKVELNRKKLDKVVVKFGYTIKITNEGQLEGYAKEISDYIPEGLKFVAEDNPQWSEANGKIVTRQLENTLLQPGESAEVKVILTWKNNQDNLGLKTNIAEISEDYNKYKEEDIDSIPNNKVEDEDDIDNAPVLLSISTGKVKTYIALTTIIMIVFASGIMLIKKFLI